MAGSPTGKRLFRHSALIAIVVFGFQKNAMARLITDRFGTLFLMPEMPHAGEDHSETGFVRGGNNFIVTH